MTKTRKVLIAVLSVMCVVCMGLFTLTACGKKNVVELDKLEITQAPDKTIYIVGEEFDAKGMVVTATLSDETSYAVEAKDYTLDVPEFTLSAKQFSASKTVKVSYTYGDKTLSADQKVTVTNKITDATITSQPETTSYFLGQSFNPKGLKINATLENGSTQEIEITKDNAQFSPADALTKGTEKVEVTYGGYTFDVAVKVLNALYVEAETGYRDGALIEQSVGGDSSNLRTDATTEVAQTGAQNLYASHLKAQFALSKMAEAEDFDADALAVPATPNELVEVFGGTKAVYNSNITVGGEIVSKLYVETVKWLKDEANAEVIDAYVESEEYEAALAAYVAGTNEDKDKWNYANDVTKYTAHAGSDGNEYYLGQNNQGNVISFLFDSDKATTGNIAFRLSSAHLYIDSGWIAIAMGDIQFNKLAEFYVNGVKYDIDDDVILEGGKTEDGSTNNILWVNWREVNFKDVAFMEGRNVIELRILEHGIAAQEGYSFAANIDTLLVAPNQDKDGKDSSELDAYPADKQINVTSQVTSIAIEKDNDKPVLTISGTVSGDEVKGYVGDLLNVKVGNANADLSLNGANFIATVAISNLALGDYDITLAGTKLSDAGLTIPDTVIDIGRKHIKYAVVEGAVVLNIDSEYDVALKTATVFDENAVLDLKLDGDKVIYSITGSYEVEIKGYDMTNAAEKAEAEAELAKLLKGYFTNLRFESKNNWQAIASLTDTHVVTIVDEDTFTMSIDVTSLNEGNGVVMNKMAAATNPNSNGDYKPKCKVEGDVKEVILNGKSYKMWIDSNSWNLAVIQVTDATASTYNTNLDGATLKVDGDKIYMVIAGTSRNYTEDDLKAAVIPTSAIDAEDANNGQNVIDLVSKVTFAFNAESGNYTISVDITELTATKWWMHFGPSGNAKADVRNTSGTDPVTCGGKTYQFLAEPQDNNSWTAYRLQVTEAAAE